MKNLKLIGVPLAGFAALCLLCGADPQGCTQDDTATSAQQQEQGAVNNQQALYEQNQGAPTFTYSLQRQMFIQLYEAQNHAVNTWTYRQSEYTGQVLWSCPSIGYPLPAGSQLTNPEQVQWNSEGTDGIASAVVPQAEPNGVYSPPDTHGTWVNCIGTDGQINPAYVEGDVETFTTPMVMKDGVLSPKPGVVSTVSLPVPVQH